MCVDQLHNKCTISVHPSIYLIIIYFSTLLYSFIYVFSCLVINLLMYLVTYLLSYSIIPCTTIDSRVIS